MQITWGSHADHTGVACRSHGGHMQITRGWHADHMGVTCRSHGVTWRSHESLMSQNLLHKLGDS